MTIDKEKVLTIASNYEVEQSDMLESFLCELLNINCMELYNSINKNRFYQLPAEQRERLLMETSARIQEVFDDMCHNDDLIRSDLFGVMERIGIFSKWTREFEYRYFDDENYSRDYIDLTDSFARQKIREVFG